MKITSFLHALLALWFTTAIALAAQPGDGEIYTVQADDRLSKIAEKYYDDALAFPTIIEATNARAATDSRFTRIDNPDVIKPGQQLWIPGPIVQTSSRSVIEHPVTEIPLTKPLSKKSAEVSSLAWYGDYLILMPQYPDFFVESGDGAVFALHKNEIAAFLSGESTEKLDPIQVPFSAPGIDDLIKGFEGFEAIAFSGDDVFLAIESENKSGMLGYLVKGRIEPDLSMLRVDTSTLVAIEAQAKVNNISDESLLIAGDTVVTIFEANGASITPSPMVHRFGVDLSRQSMIPFPNIEYRITDVTEPDTDNRFWAINYFFPGDEKLRAEVDPIADRFGKGETHLLTDGVERLVEFQYAESGITLTGTPPLQLYLPSDDRRNWEGIVQFGEGFLLATDKHPDTVLAYVEAFSNDE